MEIEINKFRILITSTDGRLSITIENYQLRVSIRTINVRYGLNQIK